jgi:hypothetical protein
MGYRLPYVVTFRISLPLDQVLQLSFPSMMLVAPDGLDFILFFASHEVRGWPQVVCAVFNCFNILYGVSSDT